MDEPPGEIPAICTAPNCPICNPPQMERFEGILIAKPEFDEPEFDDFEYEDPDDSEAVDAYAAEVAEAAEAFGVPIPDEHGRTI